MASPLSVFRKHQYWFLVVMGVMLMVAFVIAPPIDDYLRSRQQSGGGQSRAPVVTWSGGTVREMDMRSMLTAHVSTMNFLQAVLEETQKRGGQPKTREFPSRTSSEQGLLETMLLAQKAMQLGVVISDDAVADYIDRVCDQLLDHKDLNELLKQAAGGRITAAGVYERLRIELMAIHMQQMVLSGIVPSTPAQNLTNFNRLQERVVLELLPVKAHDFLDQVTQQPSDADIESLYEKYKERFPDPANPEPGFRRLPAADFAYVRLHFQTLLDEEKAKITDAEIQAEYDAGLKRGDFRRPPATTPPAEGTPPATTPPAEGTPPATTPPAEGTPPATTPPAEGTPPATTPPATTPPATTPPATTPPATTPPATTPPATTPPATTPPATTPPAEGTPAPEKKEPDGPPKDGSSSQARSVRAMRDAAVAAMSWIVPIEGVRSLARSLAAGSVTGELGFGMGVLSADGQPPDSPKSDGGSQESDKSVSPDSPPAAVPATPPAADPSAPATPPAAGPATPPAATPPAATPPAATPPAADPSAPATPPAAGPGAPPAPVQEDKPLEEVRDQIVTRLARPKAEARRTALLDGVRKEMEAYYQKRTIWTQRAEGDAAPEPTAPNLEELAAKSGMTAGRTGLVDYHTVESTELGKTSRFDQNTFSFRPFREIGFDPDIPMYRPRDIRDAKETDVEYVYWKTSVKDQFIPELGDIRDDVARDWKKLEARKLVDKRVEELRKEASEREGGLKERLPAQAEKITSTNEFSWITMGGGLIPQMNSPQLSSVEGVDAVTWEFMETVFAKKAGELGVVRNASHDSAYVFLVTRRGPDVDAQRQRFLRTFFQGGSEVAALAQGEFQDYYRRWYAQLEREMKVEWKRPPQ